MIAVYTASLDKTSCIRASIGRMRVSVLGKQLCKRAARNVCPVSTERNPCRDVCLRTRNLLKDELPQAEKSCVVATVRGIQRWYNELVGRHVCDQPDSDCQRRSSAKKASPGRGPQVIRNARGVEGGSCGAPRATLDQKGSRETLACWHDVQVPSAEGASTPQGDGSKLRRRMNPPLGLNTNGGIQGAQVLQHRHVRPLTLKLETLSWQEPSLCNGHPISIYSGLPMTGRRSSVRLCRGIDRRGRSRNPSDLKNDDHRGLRALAP